MPSDFADAWAKIEGMLHGVIASLPNLGVALLQRADALRPHRGPDLVSSHSFGSGRCMQLLPLVEPVARSSTSSGHWR